MSHSPLALSAAELAATIGSPAAPWIIDVRRREAFEAAERMIAGACWRDHASAAQWASALPPGPLVVYCVHGHQVSQISAALLRGAGRSARYLAGGFEGYRDQGGETMSRAALTAGGHWVTADPPSPGALACAWLIRRFIDRRGEIHFVETEWAVAAAKEIGAATFALSKETEAFDEMRHAYGIGLLALEGIGEGLEHVLDGLIKLHGPGDTLLEQSAAVFDAIYAIR
ncbi:MAG: chromate resistance protein ChrB domain-containing protein [Pseudomonadota bacterium]